MKTALYVIFVLLLFSWVSHHPTILGGPATPGVTQQAEQEAACLGDWHPPGDDRVNARQMCLELQRRGCGSPQQDCDRIPADQTYYTHH
jgi:hypothetical protein